MKSKGEMTRTTMILSPNNEQPTAFPASLILLNEFRWEDLHSLRSAGVLLLCPRLRLPRARNGPVQDVRPTGGGTVLDDEIYFMHMLGNHDACRY